MERPVTWVYVVAMNRVRREFRRHPGRDVASADIEDSSPTDPLSGVATSITVRSAIDRLATRQRAAIVLRYLADLTVPEVARAMRCSEGTVKSTLHAALGRLQVELGEDGEP
jgi:RNA polymerase sigma-70 factor (ECF subfamily)